MSGDLLSRNRCMFLAFTVRLPVVAAVIVSAGPTEALVQYHVDGIVRIEQLNSRCNLVSQRRGGLNHYYDLADTG